MESFMIWEDSRWAVGEEKERPFKKLPARIQRETECVAGAPEIGERGDC